MASASSAMVSGSGASARISRARMPRDSVWDGEAWALPAVGVMGSILGPGVWRRGRRGGDSCVRAHSPVPFYIGTECSIIEHKTGPHKASVSGGPARASGRPPVLARASVSHFGYRPAFFPECAPDHIFHSKITDTN